MASRAYRVDESADALDLRLHDVPGPQCAWRVHEVAASRGGSGEDHVSGGYLRGDEWYRFDPETGLITEIRAFYASAPDGRSEVTLEGYDYAANGFHLKPPVARPHPDAEYDDTEH